MGVVSAREAVRATLDILDGIGATDLLEMWVERHGSLGGKADTIVHIKFDRLADLEAFVAADKAKVAPRENHSHRGHYLWHAMYDRPGRRMLLEFRAFPHSPEWPAS